MDDETRAALAGLGTQIEQAVTALGRRITTASDELRSEMATMRDGLRSEMATMRDELDDRITSSAAENRRHFGVVAEALRAEIRAVAEGVATNTERIEQVRLELWAEMDRRFTLVDGAFREVRRDIAELRSRA